MPPQSGFPTFETLPSGGRVHVLGAGPVGLVVTALLQSTDRFSVHLYEKRRDYTRTRMVQLAPYTVADSIASYCTDYIDGESVEAIFEPSELRGEALAFRRNPFRRTSWDCFGDGRWGSARSKISSAPSVISSMRVRRSRYSAQRPPSRRRT